MRWIIIWATSLMTTVAKIQTIAATAILTRPSEAASAPPVSVHRDRDGSFEPQAIPKRSKDITGIEDKVLFMYGRGMSQRDISSTIEDIYGFSLSAESISNITDRVLEKAEAWQNRPLKPFSIHSYL